jgi:two-component system cell cycle response regulator DivK
MRSGYSGAEHGKMFRQPMSDATAPTILIVDDYPDSLEVWELYLRGEGFEVLTAATGPQALERAISAAPDAIVMDLELPGLSGYEVARRLRAREDMQRTPLIAATGYSHDAQLDEARAAGFDVILVKPCDPEGLVREIRRLLDPSRA